MTTYKQMKHALLSNNTIEMYKPTARLIEMVIILACHGIVSIVTNGTDWRVTLTRKPTVQKTLTVADVDPSPFAVLPDTPVYAHVRLADKVRYVDGKRIVSEQWSGKAYPVIGHRNGFELLDTGHGVIGRKISDLRYEPYGIAGAILPTQRTKAA